MKVLLRIIAALLVAAGVIFFFQGASVLSGSFRPGELRQAGYGIMAIAAGLVLFFAARD